MILCRGRLVLHISQSLGNWFGLDARETTGQVLRSRKPLVRGQPGGVVVQPEVVFTVRPNRSTGNKCMVASNQRYSHWCQVMDSVHSVLKKTLFWGSIQVAVLAGPRFEIFFHWLTGNRSPPCLTDAEEQGVAASLTKAYRSYSKYTMYATII